jgi:hypothetical protein
MERSARARIAAPEAFDEVLVAVHDALAALDARFRREALAAFAGRLERSELLRLAIS